MEEPQLLLLCEDVRMEIFKYLSKKDMENLSVTCKCGYDVTKDYFENQTQVIFSKTLTYRNLEVITNFQRNYKNVIVVLNEFEENIFQQLHYFKIKVSSLRLTIGEGHNIKDVPKQVLNLKTKYKIQKVLINSEDSISVLSDIKLFKDICTDVTAISIFFEDFDADFIKTFINEFQSLETLYVYAKQPINVSIDVNRSLNVRKVTFNGEISKQISFIKLFKCIHTLILIDCSDSLFLKTLLELNKATLKALQLIRYCPVDYDLVIPCQLHSLNVICDEECIVDSLISNQNELQLLELVVSFTPQFLEMLENHCAPSLNIMDCSYNSSSEISQLIPTLSIVKHLKVNHIHLADFLPKTRNIETLEISIGYEDTFNGFESLNGLELGHLTSINTGNLDKDLLNELSAVTLNIPKLEKLKCRLFSLNLLKNYSHIKYFESGCNFQDILIILKVLSKLEELKAEMDIDQLTRVLNLFENLDFEGNLKYVEITTTALFKDEIDILKKMEHKGDRIFSNFKDNGQLNMIDAIIEIDMKSKTFMYNFVSKPIFDCKV